MKKWQLVMMAATLVFMAGCSSEKIKNDHTSNENIVINEVLDDNGSIDETDLSRGQQGEIIDVTEKMYVTYINDIYTNTEDYRGKTIRLEGMFTSTYDEMTKQTYYFVYRTGPGCCGNDGNMCGLEFTTTDPLPEERGWIEVTGTLDSYEENENAYLTLRDSQVIIKEERGQEVVYQ